MFDLSAAQKVMDSRFAASEVEVKEARATGQDHRVQIAVLSSTVEELKKDRDALRQQIRTVITAAVIAVVVTIPASVTAGVILALLNVKK